jgi:hypothetical protein
MQRHGIENTVQVPLLSGLADQFERDSNPREAILGGWHTQVNRGVFPPARTNRHQSEPGSSFSSNRSHLLPYRSSKTTTVPYTSSRGASLNFTSRAFISP